MCINSSIITTLAPFCLRSSFMMISLRHTSNSSRRAFRVLVVAYLDDIFVVGDRALALEAANELATKLASGEGGKPREGTPLWWESLIMNTADYVEAQGLPAMIHIVNRTRGWGGSKEVDWDIIRDLGRRLAGPDRQHYGFGITKFCRPVRRLLLHKIGFVKFVRVPHLHRCGPRSVRHGLSPEPQPPQREA